MSFSWLLVIQLYGDVVRYIYSVVVNLINMLVLHFLPPILARCNRRYVFILVTIGCS